MMGCNIMKKPDEFKTPTVAYPDGNQVMDNALRIQQAVVAGSKVEGVEVRDAIPSNIVKGMVDIATNAWRAKAKMLIPSGEVRHEMKRVYRHIEGILESFQEIGLEVKDHTGDAFDYGLPLKVVTTQPTQGITRERVIETIKPTIYWHEQRIQMGEVIIATPASQNPIV